MLAIADAAENGWETWARAAAVALHSGADETDGSIGIRLLADIRDVFAADDRLPTAELVKRLCGLEEAPWNDWYGKPITQNFVADKLKPFGIGSKAHRFGDKTLRGYERAAFVSAWSQYLPETPATAATSQPQHPNSPDSDTATRAQHAAIGNDVADTLRNVALPLIGGNRNPATDVAGVVYVSPAEGEND